MQVVFHLGAPCTDGDLLIKSLLKSRKRLAEAGVIVPQPGRYRAIIRDTARMLGGQPANEDTQETLLDAIVDEPEIGRLVLSDPRFICINRLVVQGAQIWPMIGRQTNHLRALFPGAEVEFFIGMRDPAAHIPALFKASRFNDFDEFSANMQPHALAWSEMLGRLRTAHPDAGITVWCNEDTPLLWSEILHEMADLPGTEPLDGINDLMGTIMEKAGFKRMQAYLKSSPPETEIQRRRILSAFLDRYARDEDIEEDVDLPGWTDTFVNTLTTAYEDDMEVVSRMPGITFLTP